MDSWKIVEVLIGLVTLLLSGIGGRLYARVDAAHARLDNTVSRKDFKDELATFRDERDAQHRDGKEERQRNHQEGLTHFRELSIKLDTQAVQDQRLSQIERDLATISKYAGELKHVHIDPYAQLIGRLEERIKMLESRSPR